MGSRLLTSRQGGGEDIGAASDGESAKHGVGNETAKYSQCSDNG